MNNLRIPLALSSPTAFELSNHLLVTLQRRRSHLILSLGRTRLHGTKKRNGLIDFPRAMPIGQNRRRRRRRHGIPRSESQQHQYQRGSVGRHEVQPPSAGDAHGGGQPYGCGGVETLHRVSHVAVGVLVQVFEYQCGSEESHAGGGGRGYSCCWMCARAWVCVCFFIIIIVSNACWCSAFISFAIMSVQCAVCSVRSIENSIHYHVKPYSTILRKTR